MKKVYGGLTVLVVLGLVLAGCSNPTSSGGPGLSLPTDTSRLVDGLPTVSISGTATAGGDGTISTGNNWWRALLFSGNDQVENKWDEIIKTKLYEQIPVYDQVPVYEQIPVYKQIPTYDKVPVYKQEPVYGEEPEYDQVPITETVTVYKDVPIYKKVPIWGTEPIYGDPIPVYDQVPVYLRIPIYKYDPKYEQVPVYGEKEVFEQVPVYPQKAIWGMVPKVITWEEETWVPQWGGGKTAWGGWISDDETFPHNTNAGFEKNGVVRTGQSAWAMAIAYEGEAKEVLLVRDQHDNAGTVRVEPAGEGFVKLIVDPLENKIDDLHLGYYTNLSGFNVGNGQLNGNKLLKIDSSTGIVTALIPYSGGKLYIGFHAGSTQLRLEDKMVLVTRSKTEMVEGIIGWEDDTSKKPLYFEDGDVIGYTDDLNNIIGYTDGKIIGFTKGDLLKTLEVFIGCKDGEIIDYLQGPEIGQKDVITGYKKVQVGTKQVIIGYKEVDTGEYDLVPTGNMITTDEIVDWVDTDVVKYYKKGEFLGYVDGKQIGTKDGDLIGYEDGEFLYYVDGKFLGWTFDKITHSETIEVARAFDLVSGDKLQVIGKVFVFYDEEKGGFEVTYLFYNGVKPSEVHVHVTADPNDKALSTPGQSLFQDKNPVLTEERTYTAFIPYDYTPGDEVIISTHAAIGKD